MSTGPRILHVISRRGKYQKTEERLDAKVDHLSEYDAIVIEPTWAAMFGGRDQEPGTLVTETVAGLIDEYALELRKRATELAPFFQMGGLLVIRIDLPLALGAYREDGWVGSHKVSLDSQAWLAPLIQDHRPMMSAQRIAFPSSVPELTQAGSGRLELREPGHPFEEYLKGLGRYRCRLGSYLRNIPGAVVLAESRIGDVVAVEVPLAQGSAVIVPPPESQEDEERMELAVRRAVAQRVGARKDWVPEQERALIEARDEVLARMREERSGIDDQLRGLRAIKARVLEEDVVARSASYFRQATAPGVTPDRVMFLLYKITDLLRDHFGGGERGLADALGMTVEQIKKIKKVANLPEKDLRHASAGPTEQVTEAELSEAIGAAYEMVNQLVARRVREESSSQRPAEVTPGDR